MTVTAQANRYAYTGNAVTTSFAFSSYFIAAADIKVYIDGVLKTLTTDYTISGSAPYTGGANIVFVAAPANLSSIVLLADPSITQSVDLIDDDSFPIQAAVETPLDRLTLICRRLYDLITRSVSLSDSLGSNAVLKIAAITPNGYLKINSTGDGLETVAVGSDNSALALALAASTGAAVVGAAAGGTVQSTLTTLLANWVSLLSSVGSTLVGFIQAGTGAVLRTLQSRLREQVSVKDFGALGDGSTDDITTILAAIAALIARGGGILFFPEGNYRVSATIVVNSSVCIRFVGENLAATAISTVTNTALMTLDGGRHAVENIQLIAYGISGGAGTTVGGNSHALYVKSNCVDVYLHRLIIAGGWYSIRNDGTDTVIDNVIAYAPYGSAILYQTANALWMNRGKFDNPWPVSVPSAGASVVAWAATTAYSIGDVRSSGGFYIQCRAAGTSGGSAPTLQNYGTDIVDGAGALRWRLCCATNMSACEITTGSSEIHINQSDFSGAAQRSINVNNNGAGVAPWGVFITDSVISQSVLTTVDCVAGNSITLKGNEIFNPITNAEATVSFRSAFGGDVSVTDNLIIGSSATTGIYLGSGTNYTVSSNNIFAAQNGVLADTGASKFVISNNNVGSSAKWGTNTNSITVATGAVDYYAIVNNNVHGFSTAGVTDGGTGTHKTISGNN